MECPECSFDNREGAKFCLECGKELETKCPQCGKTLPREAKFCDGCGHELRKPIEPHRIDFQQPRSYTPQFLADKILTSRSALEGERKLVTVLFADVAGFTSMSEKLDPEDVHQIMDACFRILMDQIHRFDGTVNEFRGDGVMALFGAPIAHEDHAQRACHASLAIQKALIPYSAKLHNEYGVDFKMRIGLNSGPVVVGAIGDDLRMDYTALGDTANLAARMETNAQPGSVLLSEHTYRLAKEFFEFEPIGEIQVKGKDEPLEAYHLMQPSVVATRIEASAARGLTRFVGRRRELETLKEAFDKARSGEGQVVGVVGEAGVGKSRLLLEFRNSLPKGEYIYLEGRCLHYGSSMPYLPILDVFRTYLRIKEGEKESVIKQNMQERIVGSDETLMGCLPPIQELFSVKVDDEGFAKLEPKQKRERTFEAIRDILIRGSQSRPIVWAVEDLHWIDKTTEEFLDYMIGWLPNARMVLLFLYRPEYTHQWGSKSYYSQIGVGQLSSGTSAELVQAILEGGHVVPELRDLILSRASGNPLYMEELTHSLLENGSIQKQGGQFILARTVSEIQVPDTIQGIIAARMDRLEESLKRIMQVASVIGREFAFRILQAIAEMQEDLKSNLLNLQGLEFIYEKSLFPELEYIFRHALTQEVAYNSLLLKRRKEIHEKIGQAIEDLYPERLEDFYEMLAYHYSKSENAVKTCHYLKASGEKATRNNSLWEAFDFFRKALDILLSQPETHENQREQIETILMIAAPMRLLGYPRDSLKILERGQRLAEDIDHSKAAATLYALLGLYHSIKGAPQSQREYQEMCFHQAQEIGDVDLLVPTAFDLCVSYMATGEWFRMLDKAAGVIRLLEQTGRENEFFGRPPNPYSFLLGYYGICLAITGNFKEGVLWLEKARIAAAKLNHVFSMGAADFMIGYVFVTFGDGEHAIKYYRKSLKLFEEAQALIWLGLAWSVFGFGYYLLGDLETARHHIEKGLKIQTKVGMPLWMSEHHRYLSMVHFDLGNQEAAMTHAEESLRLSLQSHNRHSEASSRISLGRIMVQTDRSKFEKAEDHIRQGINMLEELRLRPACAVGCFHLGELYADRGHNDKAVKNLKKAESMCQEMGMDYWLGKTQEVLARL